MKERNHLLDRDALNLLRWQVESGVDEAIDENPRDWTKPQIQPPSPSLPVKEDEAPSEPVTMRPKPAGVGAGMAVASMAANPAGDPSTRQRALAAADLAELFRLVDSFDGCSLKKTATQTVFGDGNPRARIVVVGEAPGADEDRIGRPFVGVSGRLLDDMLAAIGLDRDKIYIMNVVYWRPPGNRHPTAEEIALCLPFAQRQIELIAPDLLIAVGGVAGAAILARRDGITRYRGQWLTYQSTELPRPIPAMAIYHPAFLLRQPARKRETWQDLLNIQEKAEQLHLFAPAAS